MCIMVKRFRREDEMFFSDFTTTPLPINEHEVVLSLGQELALAGDELGRKFSKPTRQDEGLQFWSNVKRYAVIMTFRLIFGFI